MNKITNKVKEAIRFKSAIWKFDNADNEVAAAIAEFYREYNDANVVTTARNMVMMLMFMETSMISENDDSVEMDEEMRAI